MSERKRVPGRRRHRWHRSVSEEGGVTGSSEHGSGGTRVLQTLRAVTSEGITVQSAVKVFQISRYFAPQTDPQERA
jgi:hypothetical protein